MLLHLIAASLLPSALILLWVFSRDRLREPPRVVAVTALLGAVTVVPAAIIEPLLAHALGVGEATESVASALLTGFVVAAVVEEALKWMVLQRYAVRHDAFDEPFDGIVYGTAVGLGFAAAENLAYVLPNGLGIGRYSDRGRAAWTMLGVAGAIALHGTYDAFAFAASHFSQSDADGVAALCGAGTLGTLGLGLGAAALGIARMRRDQERAMLAGRPTVPTWSDLDTGTGEAFPSPPALPTDTIPPAMHAPVLPMIALVSGVASMAALVALALIGSLVDDQGWQAHPIGVGLSALACLVIGGVGTLGGLFIGPLALVREPRWKPASISGTVLAACAAALVVIALLAPE